MSQLKEIEKILETTGLISRNYCLRNYLTSRLAARINDLREKGYEFEEEKVGGDFVYKLKAKPQPKQLTLV